MTLDEAWARCEARLDADESITLAKNDPTGPAPRMRTGSGLHVIPYRAAFYRRGTFAYASNAPTAVAALTNLADALDRRAAESR